MNDKKTNMKICWQENKGMLSSKNYIEKALEVYYSPVNSLVMFYIITLNTISMLKMYILLNWIYWNNKVQLNLELVACLPEAISLIFFKAAFNKTGGAKNQSYCLIQIL